MYCVIQEIENKKENQYGAARELEAYRNEWTIMDEKHISYDYRYTKDRFKRPIKKAYKISIHQSYREDGKVKKRQWVICTMGYYDITSNSAWIKDYMLVKKWNSLLEDIGISEEKLCNLVYKKLDPLIEQIQEEFKHTEEYKVHKKNSEIIQKYIRDKEDFEKIYGSDSYEKCFDVFGVVRNEELLEQIKQQHEAAKEYQRSYYENYNSNYNSYSNSSDQNIIGSSYNEENKDKYKKLYKTLAKTYHPDIIGDDGEMMKLVNQLKEDWNL